MTDVVGVVGSARKQGNTELLMQRLLSHFERDGFDVEMIGLADKRIEMCRACDCCQVLSRCVVQDDFEEIYAKLFKAKGIIIASPVYSYGPAPQLMSCCIRASRLAHSLGVSICSKEANEYELHASALAGKIGASFAVARRAGGSSALSLMNVFFLRNQMYLVGSARMNIVFGDRKGAVLEDREGVANLDLLAENIGWLMKRIAPAEERKRD